MNNIDIVNGLVFQALSISKNTFDDRLLAQKKIYLLQNLGIQLGFSYNWYIRGPYSPGLSNYLFENLDLLKDFDLKKYCFSELAERAIDILKGFEKNRPGTLSNARWYELLASIVFIHKNWVSSDSDLYVKLHEYKPQYTTSEFEDAKAQLKSCGLL